MERSTRWLVKVNIVGALLVTLVIVCLSVNFRLSDHIAFKLFLFAHILGAVIFLGNIIITGVWMLLAERSGNDEVVKFAVRAVNWADALFTAPGVYLILVGGLAMAQKVGISHSWIITALVLFGLSGLIWYFYLIPVQDKMVRLASKPTRLTANFYDTLHRWYVWGVIATVLPLLILVLMVDKPRLW